MESYGLVSSSLSQRNSIASSSESTINPSSPLQKSACLACRKRKIKCDRQYPCTACRQSEIQCGFVNTCRTKSRSKVLQRLRHLPIEEQIELTRQGPASSIVLDTKLLNTTLVEACKRSYLEHCHPINIILDGPDLNRMTDGYHDSAKRYSLTAALCAVAIYSCDPSCESLESITAFDLSTLLIAASLQARASYDHLGRPDFESILISFMLSIATFQQGHDNRSWFYLRESCTIIQTLGLHKESTYQTSLLSPSQIYQRRLLYYLISISERANSLHRNLPVTLDHTIAFPMMNRSDPIHCGFIYLHDLFAPFDHLFTTYRDQGILPFRDPNTYLLDLHSRVQRACPGSFSSAFNESIIADLLVTKAWLLTQLYHLSIKYSLLLHLSPESDMGILYPIKIVRDLHPTIARLKGSSFEVHGGSMLEKLYELANTLIDLVDIVPIAMKRDGYGTDDLLGGLLSLVATLRKGHNDFLPRLLEKVHSSISASGQGSREGFYANVGYEFEDLFTMYNTRHNSDSDNN